jgi:putative transposase
MRDLLGGYARSWNRNHGRRGHLFGQRFYEEEMVDDSQLLTTASYIDLNPVRAKLCFRPEQWPWSSYRAHVGLDHPSRLLANAEFLKHVGPTPGMARKAYRRFVAERRLVVPGTALDAA